jgi:hypothetical protein
MAITIGILVVTTVLFGLFWLFYRLLYNLYFTERGCMPIITEEDRLVVVVFIFQTKKGK